MVILRVIDILNERNLSKYWLWQRMGGMSYQNLLSVVNNKTSKISFDTLDRLSKALELPVGDLFEQINDNEVN